MACHLKIISPLKIKRWKQSKQSLKNDFLNWWPIFLSKIHLYRDERLKLMFNSFLKRQNYTKMNEVECRSIISKQPITQLSEDCCCKEVEFMLQRK